MDRAAAAQRYAELPLPDTTQEHWRFTDLKGFDPAAFAQNGSGSDPLSRRDSMLDLDIAGLATVAENGIEIERAPEGIRFEPLDEGHPRLHELVGADEKFAAHNAAVWKHGLLVHVPRGVELEQPLYVRVASAVGDGSLFFRLLVIAEPGSRFTLIEEYSSASPEQRSYSNVVAELSLAAGGPRLAFRSGGEDRSRPRRRGEGNREREEPLCGSQDRARVGRRQCG